MREHLRKHLVPRTERVIYLDDNGREVHFVRFKDIRNWWTSGYLNALQVEYLADHTNEMNTIGDKEDYPDMEAMLETIEGGWITQA